MRWCVNSDLKVTVTSQRKQVKLNGEIMYKAQSLCFYVLTPWRQKKGFCSRSSVVVEDLPGRSTGIVSWLGTGDRTTRNICTYGDKQPSSRRMHSRTLPSHTCTSDAAVIEAHDVHTEAPDLFVGGDGGSAMSASRLARRAANYDAPLLQTLMDCAEQETAAFHFPGHRRGRAAPPALAATLGDAVFQHDLPELPELDNLFAPDGVIKDAQTQAAHLFDADETFFLVNGSTCGIQAAIIATCASGDHLILPRNCHMSAVSGMVLSGALPKYIMPAYDSVWGIAHGVIPSTVDAAISEVSKQGGRVAAVLLVSPTYYGACSDVASIAEACHLHGIPLIVDEAHGGHFKFQEQLPPTALEQGADVVVQSTHKVLGSLTQSAMLHLKGRRVNRNRLRKCLQVLQSSSPSYLLLASLDAARAHMSQQGSTVLSQAVMLARDARCALKLIPGIHVLDEQRVDSIVKMARLDPLRITIGLWDLGITGFEADDILRLEYGVIAELPLLQSITFALSAGTTRNDIRRLVDGIRSLSSRHQSMRRPSCVHSSVKIPEPVAEGWSCLQKRSPREAFFADSEAVTIEDSVGRVSAELLCPYPPGIPVVAPGEMITDEAVGQLKAVLEAGGIITGAADSALSTLVVMQQEPTC